MKQLKKNDFLNAVSHETMTRGELVDALDEFEFIDSYLDYLTDHFVNMKKITKDEDGNLQRVAKKTGGGGPRTMYQVAVDNDTGDLVINEFESKPGDGVDAEKAKIEGWRATRPAAVKAATQAAFAGYKAETVAIRALLESDDS